MLRRLGALFGVDWIAQNSVKNNLSPLKYTEGILIEAVN
jgi:hypothetical protein